MPRRRLKPSSALWQGSSGTLKGAQATMGAAKAAMSCADVVHVAAHGVFRGDNPLLSSIRLSDGPMTGDELAQATKTARLVVLSCCNSGMADASGIGLSRLLTRAGATAVVASVSPVSDAGSVELMIALHGELVRGGQPGERSRRPLVKRWVGRCAHPRRPASPVSATVSRASSTRPDGSRPDLAGRQARARLSKASANSRQVRALRLSSSATS